jgi:RNA polymerase sigma factor (sigma-70 family)
MMVMGPDVLGRLIDRHAPALILYARQWCNAPEDVVQEAFVKLCQEKPAPANVVPWVYRVVRNGALGVARAARRRERHEEAAAARQPVWFVPESASRLDAAEATAALERLSPEQREVIVAHLWGELTFEQVAELMGCSASTAQRWYAAALAALRERLNVPWPNRTSIGN